MIRSILSLSMYLYSLLRCVSEDPRRDFVGYVTLAHSSIGPADPSACGTAAYLSEQVGATARPGRVSLLPTFSSRPFPNSQPLSPRKRLPGQPNMCQSTENPAPQHIEAEDVRICHSLCNMVLTTWPFDQVTDETDSSYEEDLCVPSPQFNPPAPTYPCHCHARAAKLSYNAIRPSTSSLSSSITDYEYENGRRYHSFKKDSTSMSSRCISCHLLLMLPL